MRFRHLDPAPVLRWLRTEPAIIDILAWDNEPKQGAFGMLLRNNQQPRRAEAARRTDVDEVEFFAQRGKPTHAGTVLRHYFHVNTTVVGRPLILIEAVEHVEEQGAENELLLAGHPDGGLISVSRERLAFQSGDPITWWGPR